MNIQFKLEGRSRKQLAAAVSEITGVPAVYKFMPSCSFEIGNFTVTREGYLEFDDNTEIPVIKSLIDSLAEKGFVTATVIPFSEIEKVSEESETEPHSPTVPITAATDSEPNNRFTVSMPREFFDDVTFGKLDRLIESKTELFKQAFKTASLNYKVTDTEVQFPWFSDLSDETDFKAYCDFISAFCKMAKEQKRINKSQAQTDNPKFAMRVFLIRLGFVGDEHKVTRKILLRNLSGSAAYRKKGETGCSDED